MKLRISLTGLAAGLTAAALAFAAPASAATVTTTLNHSFFVGAEWGTDTPTGATDTLLSALQSSGGLNLFLDQVTVYFDASGNTTGAVETATAETGATSGFTLTHTALNTATLTGTAVPVTVCTFDASFNDTGCSQTTTALSATWTGQGLISDAGGTVHFRIPGHSNVIVHFSDLGRGATAAGVVNNIPVTVDSLFDAEMIKATVGTVEVCTGATC
jgi:hypothetical protein